VSHIDALVASPKVTRTIAHLEQSMAHIDRITDRMEGKVGPLVESLRQTSQEAQSAVRSADAVLGGRVGSQDRNLPSALHELTRAARAMRALADYLDRHPEAVISGR
jgi:hypothetical protein